MFDDWGWWGFRGTFDLEKLRSILDEWLSPRVRRRHEAKPELAEGVARTIESFLDGTAGERDWSEFLTIPVEDPYLDQIRERAGQVRDRFLPRTGDTNWTSDEGVAALRELALEARAYAAARRAILLPNSPKRATPT